MGNNTVWKAWRLWSDSVLDRGNDEQESQAIDLYLLTEFKGSQKNYADYTK